MQQGNTQGAADAYQAALQLDPEYVEAWLNLGSALLCKSQLPEALNCYQRALADGGGKAQRRNDLARAQYSAASANVQILLGNVRAAQQLV